MNVTLENNAVKCILQKETLLKIVSKVRYKLCLKRGGRRGGVWSKWPKHFVEIGKVECISLERLKGVSTNLLFILNCIL